MELYFVVGTIIISSCLIFSFYMFKKEQLVNQIKKEQTNQPNQEQEQDEKEFIRNMSEEQAEGYFRNSIYNEHTLEQGESAKDFLISRCSKHWPENFPYNYQ